MISGFGKLSEEQIQITKDALVWITVLIAGADGKIDSNETEWATKVTKIRTYNSPDELKPYYEAVGPEYAAKLEELIASAPKDLGQRQEELTNKLEQLNDILPLLDDNLGHHMVASFRSFAMHVAKASGGFLGFFSIGSAESKLVELPMIADVPWISSDSEEDSEQKSIKP